MNKLLQKEAHVSTTTLNRKEIEEPVGSIYKAITIVAKRTDQISEEIKTELIEKLEEFAMPISDNNLEEVFDNKEQIEISKFYESLPKPHAIALQEWLTNQIYHRDTKEDKNIENIMER